MCFLNVLLLCPAEVRIGHVRSREKEREDPERVRERDARGSVCVCVCVCVCLREIERDQSAEDYIAREYFRKRNNACRQSSVIEESHRCLQL